MEFLSWAPCLLTVAFILWLFYKRWTRVSFPDIRGPESKSWSLGKWNMGELLQNQVALTEFKWQELYGNVVRFKAPFNNDRLLITDPKALQYILQTSGYNWQKYTERREIGRMTGGKGILWAEGDTHRRQRKVMLPGFGFPEAKNFLPLFFSCAESMSARWRDIISSNNADQPAVINIPEWTSRATLDAIGQAAFDYEFGAINDDDNELQKVYRNMMPTALGSPSDSALIGLDLAQYLPVKVLEFITDHVPSQRLTALRRAGVVVDRVAKELVEMKSKDLLEGKGKKDIMSLLMKANASENPRVRLSDAELIAQMRTLILAGHETTSNTLTWTMLEMARHPHIQTRLRKEIQEKRRKLRDQGRSEFNVQDFDTMPYLTAVVKETLRFHPVAIHLYRQAVEDDVLPLSMPITTTTGQVLTKLPVPKGTRMVGSIHAYNRNKDIFGQDADEFNPERWLTPNYVKTGVSLGVYANLATFSAGVHSCIGWRFAIIELQAFIIEMIRNFEFSKTPKTDKVRREACLVMVPTIEGEVEKGSQLPLRVGFAPREEDEE
ncbi:cytochrome P450 [Dendrothele bispora CBS 962.96]|uniref:Cytochrome P450 n=1 Tax=Dendrothele bispora (strain CBS 962.96) TaxID=1314807 RepID=A0A4S8MUA3_DENBC|nr:cytochrome P450 [Dendrothele bispora CBS 962.96]